MSVLSEGVLKAAKELKEGKVSFLDGIRVLSDFGKRFSTDSHDDDFLIFIVVASETDHMPSDQMRHLCSGAWLKQCDEALDAYISRIGGQIDTACDKLIARFEQCT